MAKVRYIVDHPDPGVGPGFVFTTGTVAEHEDPEAERRVAAGVCVLVDPNARARKLDQNAAIEMECIPSNAPEPKEVQPTRDTGKGRRE